MQNYYYQPQNRFQPQQNILQQPLTLKGRPVTGIEEVRAAAVDFDGSVSFFPDLANGRIFTKQCNIDGTAALNMYELKEIPTNDMNNQSYVTRTEFNQAMAAIKEALTPKTKIEGQNQTSPENNKPPEFHF